MHDILRSHILQILLTLLAGVSTYIVVYFVCSKLQKLLCLPAQNPYIFSGALQLTVWLAAIFLGITILISFLFDLGETYQYSRWYKRSFGPFGDGFPFSLILLQFFGFYLKSNAIIVISLAVALMSGGRMVIATMLLSVLFICFIKKTVSAKNSVILLLLPLSIYSAGLIISNDVIDLSVKTKVNQYVETSLGITSNPSGRSGREACRTQLRCYETQIAQPIRQRLITSAAGLWMTIQGGYLGAAYPGTSEKFADFMMKNDPFGLNKKFKLDWRDWYDAGGIQNPYLDIGSGYGPIGLALVLLLNFFLAAFGYKQLRNGLDISEYRALTVFLIFLSLANQTQPWIRGGSLLLFMFGVAAAHILTTEMTAKRRAVTIA